MLMAKLGNNELWRWNTTFFCFCHLMGNRPIKDERFVFKEHFGDELFSPFSADRGADGFFINEVVGTATACTEGDERTVAAKRQIFSEDSAFFSARHDGFEAFRDMSEGLYEFEA